MNLQKFKQKGLLWAFIGATTFAGAAGGATLLAHAQTTTPAPSVQQAPTSNQDNDVETNDNQRDMNTGGHVGKNGQKEVVLTGDTAEKVKAAALAAVPGATVQRVETDAEGSPYEAHIKKSDGSMATVKVDGNFKVTSTEDGPGARI